MAKNVLLDTGFWIAYHDPADSHYVKARDIMPHVERANVLLPWPILYETLRTSFVKHKLRMQAFERLLMSLPSERIDDSEYRRKALDDCLLVGCEGRRALSLVDLVIRHIIQDRRWKVDFLVTCDPGDFEDVCKKRGVQLHAI